MANLGNIFDYQNDPNKSKYDGSGGKGGRFPKPNKPIIIYYIVAVLLLLLINTMLVPYLKEKSIVSTSYTEFLTELDKSNVDQVELDENTITYTLKSTGADTVYKTGRINNYFGEVDRMYRAGANFTEEIPTSVSPVWLIIYNLLPFILLIWFGSRLHGHGRHRQVQCQGI